MSIYQKVNLPSQLVLRRSTQLSKMRMTLPSKLLLTYILNVDQITRFPYEKGTDGDGIVIH